MTSLRILPATATTAVLAALLISPAAASAQRTDIGTVSGSTAAAQLRRGLPSADTPAWAKTTLPTLTVRPDGAMTGYSRDLFPHWRDASTWGWPVAPNNACDARNAALYRDGQGVTMSSTCTYLKGTWIDPYGAHRYDSTSDIDIDHIVPLAAAWRSGAASWPATTRTAYANNPLVLVSADDSLNSSKGDKGPEAWKPPNKASWCLYAVRWVAVKRAWTLTVNPAEKTALTSMLATCPA